MSKYLNLFKTKTEADAAVYDENNTPNVSYCEEDNSVKYTEKILPPLEATFVDLGLPSGLKWAAANLGAESETDTGLYYMWGETEGHVKDSGYDFYATNYTAKGLNTISTDLTLAQDAANVRLGGDWRIPTNAEFEELLINTNITWTTINGVSGCKFANKTDASKYIFMPACGLFLSSSLDSWGSYGHYWSSTFKDESNAYKFILASRNSHTDYSTRYNGYTVRAVCSK